MSENTNKKTPNSPPSPTPPTPSTAHSFTSNPTQPTPKKPIDEVIRDVNFKKDAFSKIIHGKIGGVDFSEQPIDRMLRKVEDAIGDAKSGVNDMIRKGAGVRKQDRDALRPLILAILLERFDKFSNDDLMNFAAILVADRIMNDIEASPWGGSTPDLLS
jgi:hypothetical protein